MLVRFNSIMFSDVFFSDSEADYPERNVVVKALYRIGIKSSENAPKPSQSIEIV